ncbi:hypothetical protein [Gilvimarinus algae]|uniref:Cardiolipin synthase N-terminal domain-containing protein n=1 Tax=Gilvimarinus algae TaxID=3058037 RepID=A0ABT8TK61_9GAMM|nr:hypothetical protein [Gilvimarinus sp. SDUM040014]MDO3383874.1 hypothetical protein [Gilvimarinus sp. SDUM040014]
MGLLNETAIVWGALPLALILWALPLLDVTYSRRVTGGEKLAWLAACAVMSWLAWIVFFLAAPVTRPDAR